jgi:uncharacterized protein (DUF2141 family)
MTTLSWINVTNFFDSSYLSGSGTKESSVPFDVMNQTMAGSSGSYGASADVHVYVDAGGYLHVDVTNFDLNFLTYKYVRISGSVTATASVVQTSTSSPMLVVLPSTVNVSAGAGTTSFTVNNSGNGTMPWSAWVSEGSDWLSITSGASGSNSGTISVSFAANTVTESRIAKIQVTAAGATGSPKEITIVQAAATVVRTLGDANGDSKVDVGDLGILAANYGGTGKTWAQGDFNGDGKVDVGDLGILAANYGTGSSSASDFDADYAKVFGAADSMSSEDSADESDSSICSSLGLSLVAGLAMMGLMMVKLEE